jgi:hypothetical protein
VGEGEPGGKGGGRGRRGGCVWCACWGGGGVSLYMFQAGWGTDLLKGWSQACQGLDQEEGARVRHCASGIGGWLPPGQPLPGTPALTQPPAGGGGGGGGGGGRRGGGGGGAPPPPPPPSPLVHLPRGAPLSKGWLTKEKHTGKTCCVCPYHGWAFDGEGHVRDMPSAEPGRWPKRQLLSSYPVSEGSRRPGKGVGG